MVCKRWSGRGRRSSWQPISPRWHQTAANENYSGWFVFPPVLQHARIPNRSTEPRRYRRTCTRGRKTSPNTKVRAEQKSLEEDRKSTGKHWNISRPSFNGSPGSPGSHRGPRWGDRINARTWNCLRVWYCFQRRQKFRLWILIKKEKKTLLFKK